MIPTLSAWVRLAVILAAQTCALVALGAVLQRLLRAPQIRRALWQAVFIGIGLVLVSELSDARGKVKWFASSQPAQPGLASNALVLTEAPSRPPDSFSAASAARNLEQPRPIEDAIARDSHSLKPITPVRWPGWVWFLGTALLWLRSASIHAWLAAHRGKMGRADRATRALVERLRAPLRLSQIEMRVWSRLCGPIAFGIWRPTVALPGDFSLRFNPAQREAMLAHELAHFAARDPFWLALADAICALVWWHPAVWWARRELRAASEAAADEASALLPAGPAVLAEALIKFGSQLASSLGTHGLGLAGAGFQSALGKRVAALLENNGPWTALPAAWRWSPRFLALGIAVACALAPVQTGFTGSVFEAMRLSVPSPEIGRATSAHRQMTDLSNTNQVPDFRTDPWRVSSRATEPAPSDPNRDKPDDTTARNSGRVSNGIQTLPPPGKNDAPALVLVTSPTTAPAATPLENNQLPSDASTLPISAKPRHPQVKLLVRLAEISERGFQEIGLDWLFGQSPTNNPAPENGPATNFLHGATLAHSENFRVDYLRTVGQSATLTQSQFSALLKSIQNRDGTDVLTAPPVVVESGGISRVKVGDVHSIVAAVQATDGSPANNYRASINYLTEQVQTGPAVDIVAEPAGDAWRLTVLADVTEFLGYDRPKGGEVKAVDRPGNKPVFGQKPLPRFRIGGAQATALARPGETIALRGPRIVETNIIKGSFFRKRRLEILPKRLYVFVTVVAGVAEPQASARSPAYIVTVASALPFLRTDADGPVTLDRLQATLTEQVANNPDILVQIRTERDAPVAEVLKVIQAVKDAKVRVTPSLLVLPGKD